MTWDDKHFITQYNNNNKRIRAEKPVLVHWHVMLYNTTLYGGLELKRCDENKKYVMIMQNNKLYSKNNMRIKDIHGKWLKIDM